MPTLRVLRKKLLAQPEEEAQRLALSLELFTSGSLNAFAHETNVDTQNRMVVYDIHDLGRQLKTMGLLVITDAMLNQAASDREKLADKLNISEEQLGYITNAEAGCGLIRYGSALVPFKNRFPKNTELYRLMTTKPGENL